ncbi:hypothetical protein IQ235_07840 [Oscillatoriales cyanobacterium LEGE 11467]|uniref:Uncharacterized protein n=1 Tax=Zarconia navalis LEGE 11467 TaxID=1828826 RepID=A0A928Z8L5_9CYAN|nr:hypothetical protein [Zarconia navalis]MBE9040689.1 hypothetical protein [Zarconia navalis LEGE 11467]
MAAGGGSVPTEDEDLAKKVVVSKSPEVAVARSILARYPEFDPSDGDVGDLPFSSASDGALSAHQSGISRLLVITHTSLLVFALVGAGNVQS